MKTISFNELNTVAQGSHYSFIDSSRTHIVGMFKKGLTINTYFKHEKVEIAKTFFLSAEEDGYSEKAVFHNSNVTLLDNNNKAILIVLWTQYNFNRLYEYFHREFNKLNTGKYYFQIPIHDLDNVLGVGAIEYFTKELKYSEKK